MACYAEEKKMVKGREGGRRKAVRKRRGSNSRVLVSSPMLTKVDAVLQTQVILDLFEQLLGDF